MVMPEVITGPSMLLLFVSTQQRLAFRSERGVLTIWVGHVTLCTACHRGDPFAAGGDGPLAGSGGMDLGARRFENLFVITCP